MVAGTQSLLFHTKLSMYLFYKFRMVVSPYSGNWIARYSHLTECVNLWRTGPEKLLNLLQLFIDLFRFDRFVEF